MKKILFLLLTAVAISTSAQQVVSTTVKFNNNVTFNDSTVGNPTKVPVTTFEDTLRYTPGAGAGKVLTTDANGNAYWTNVVVVDTFSGTPVFPSGIKTDTVFTTDFNGTGYVMQLVNDTTGLFKPMVFVNGLTKTGDTIKLGGDIITGTTLAFDPNDKQIIFGNVDSNDAFYYGNVLGDGRAILGANDIYNFSVNGEDGNEGYNIGALFDSGLCEMDFSVTGSDYNYGLFIYDNSGKKTANIYYGLWDGASVTDISRLEANKNEVHGRHIIDSTAVVGNYNGFHANGEYAQLEYNKEGEDGQETGTLFTINNSGYVFFDDSVLIAYIDTLGNAVTNSLHTDSFRLTDGTEGAGKVLTSDANGNATWEYLDTIYVFTGQTASLDTIPLHFTDDAGNYQVEIYLVTTTADAGAGTVLCSINWNDGTAERNAATYTCALSSLDFVNHITGAKGGGYYRCDGSQPIRISTTVATAGTSQYALYVTVHKD